MSRRSIYITLVISSVFAVAAGSASDGFRAWEDGRYKEAYEQFVTDREAAGDEATPEHWYNEALAAFVVGELTPAETAAAQAATLGGEEFTARRDFLMGNVAWYHERRAEATATGPESGFLGYDVAIAYARSALESWARAAVSRPDWPAASRNAERALLRVIDLERKKAAAGPPAAKTTSEPQRIAIAPSETGDPETEETTAEITESRLTQEQLGKLRERLAEKERAKRTLRREAQRRRRRAGERDW